jgi:hypothetical protein
MGKKRTSQTLTQELKRDHQSIPQKISAQIIPFVQERQRGKRLRGKESFDANHHAQILFFMGVRYERHDCEEAKSDNAEQPYERYNQSA